jgi:hypothetical protein
LKLEKGRGRENEEANSVQSSRFLSPAAAMATFEPEFISVPL